MKGTRKVLWLGQPHLPPANVRQAVGGHWELMFPSVGQSLQDQLKDVPVALVYPNGTSENPEILDALLSNLELTNTVGVFLLPPEARQAQAIIAGRRGLFLCLRQDAPANELAAQISAAASLQPAIKALRRELCAARVVSSGSAKALEELDEEMRLAARLQRDFLPRRLPEVGSGRFGVLYQPASWVSGDIYDVARLDETHVGFYVADVVGHGMPAALLTMFIKKALQTKRIIANEYQIVPPDVTLCELNTDICLQNLSSCQFCTAVYCVFDSSNQRLTFARGGHPEPILFHRDGSSERLSAQGALLGIFPEETFPAQQVQLNSGDRLVLYSDGAEEALRSSPQSSRQMESFIGPLARRPRDELLMSLAARIESRQDPRQRRDDITLLVFDVE